MTSEQIRRNFLHSDKEYRRHSHTFDDQMNHSIEERCVYLRHSSVSFFKEERETNWSIYARSCFVGEISAEKITQINDVFANIGTD